MIQVESFAEGKWHASKTGNREVRHAVTGEPIANVSSSGLDFNAMLDYGRTVGGPALRRMTFHERGRMLKAIAMYLNDNKKELYRLSGYSGATKRDAWTDIDGGIGTFFIFSSKGRRELPDETFLMDGQLEMTSRNGTFVGHHICVPLEGVAIHINAYNFPCWGMLEKLGPTFLAGMPAIVKPASVTSYITEAVVKLIIKSGLLPDGALQLICGGVGDLLDNVTGQDVVTFTGSATTGLKLRSKDTILRNSVRFNMEADSLNFSMLGPDVSPGTEEFDLFIDEVAKEMSIKTGQRCTAIRRTFIHESNVDAVIEALSTKLASVRVGDPSVEGIEVGPLVSADQVAEVAGAVESLSTAGEVVFSGADAIENSGDGAGAFHPMTLLYCDKPFSSGTPHDVEAFGPVNTIMPYSNLDEAIELAKLGQGSLVGSLVTADADVARTMVLGSASHHGRLMVLDSTSAKESTGHGSPLAHLVHGGPGRAGGGEEMGGVRAVHHYMQRTAIQGSPQVLSSIGNEWYVGADRPESQIHPFKKYFDELSIGETLTTHRRTVTEADVVNFAGVSGDYFYAHMDDIAAKESLFERRVAHGYFVLSAAAGLFVFPNKGPVLANYGLDNLRFTQPVYPGDTIQARLTCKRKTEKEPREEEVLQGVVEWHVDVTNQDDELVATYTILTLVERQS
ncbi:MAG: phenylacetic acid degradation bifunctional protein PaaZ [Rhodothermales bacterium]|nr:phenylacetic acid degradation bifunctional protein PaaZ [Rhodothermales bacterium]